MEKLTGGGGGVKRKASGTPTAPEPEAKKPRSQKMDEIRAMLARKSTHHKEAEKVGFGRTKNAKKWAESEFRKFKNFEF